MDMALSCHLNVGGLSHAAQEFYRLFRARGLRVVPILMGPPEPEWLDKELADEMMAAANRQYDPGPLHFHVGIPETIFQVKGRAALACSTVVEGNVLTGQQARMCAEADAILAPSRFCLRTLASSGLPRRKLSLVPYPLDSARWSPEVAPSLAPSGRFRFLWMNTWYERKGYDVLLRAWWEEFSADDPVELVVKSHAEDTRQMPLEGAIALLASDWRVQRSRRAPVTVLDRPFRDDEIPGFVKSFDALVSPHRSEGFGMQPWHAMALGVPVVCTAHGGVMDFASDETAWLVRVESLCRPSASELAIFPQFRGIVWAEPDVADLRRQMRACLGSSAEREKRAKKAAALVAREYSFDSVASRARAAISKAAPGAWEAMMARPESRPQPMPRRAPGKPIRMAEI